VKLREDVTELLRHPGDRKHVTKSMAADELAITTAHGAPGTEVVLDADLESLGDGIVVTGTVSFAWEGECRRCLEPVRGESEVDVRELYTRLDDGDTYPLGEGEVDLEPLLRETVLVNLPLAPLCKDDCAGPAPEVFPTGTATEPEDEDEAPARDPRWAALDALHLEDDAE
jgi:uncharacterized protein